MKQWRNLAVVVAAFSLLAAAQTVYQPKFARDPARSDSEAAALGYMRTVVAAEKVFKKKHGRYAASLPELVGSGSFTRRMTNTQRGEYVVQFRPAENGYALTLTPAQIDVTHRAFYVDQTGVIRGDEGKPATAASPAVK